MSEASLQALLVEYRQHADWLESQAASFESGARKITSTGVDDVADLSEETAQEFRHKAGNMRAILIAFERLRAKGK